MFHLQSKFKNNFNLDVDFKDQIFFNHLSEGGQTGEMIEDCLFHIAICHTIITEEKEAKLIYNVLILLNLLIFY